MNYLRTVVGTSLTAGALLAGAIPAAAGTSFSNHHQRHVYSTGGVTSPIGNQPYLHLIKQIAFPSPYKASTSFDISWVDSAAHAFYLADRTNNGIDAVNTASDAFGSVIGAGDFTGDGATATSAQSKACGAHGTGGPNGVIAITVGTSHQLVGADGVSATAPVSNVKVFNLTSPTAGTLAATIKTAVSANGTTGSCRADEMAYDPKDQLLIVANDLDNPPYVSLISMSATASNDHIVAQIKFPNAKNGLEQPVYDPVSGNFLQSVPGVGVAVISPKTMAVTTTYPTPPDCVGSGLALNPATGDMLVSCSVNPNGALIMSSSDGSIVGRFPQVSGADEVWFDPGTSAFYLGANHMTLDSTSTGSPTPVLGVIADPTTGYARSHSDDHHTMLSSNPFWVTNAPTGPTTNNAHSVAADAGTHEVFVPLAGLGIGVFAFTTPSNG